MRRLAIAASLSAAAAFALACGDDEEPAATPPSDLPDASLDDALAADDARADATVEPSCRTPRAPSDACAADPTGCERRTLYISPTSTFPFALATDAENVYWVAQSGGDPAYDGDASAAVMRVAKSGASTQPAIVLAADQARATTLVRDGDDLYWIVSRATDGGGASTLRRLRSAAKAAGWPACAPPEDLASFPGVARRLVRAGAGVLFTVDDAGVVRRLARGPGASFSAAEVGTTSAAPSLAAADEQVFAGGGESGRVLRIPAGGGAAAPFLALPDAGPDAGLPGAYVLGAACDRLYGIHDEGAFFGSGVDAGNYVGSAASFALATDIAADEGFVYVSRRKGGGVSRGRRDGTGFVTVYAGDVARLWVDDDGIYWGEHAKGAIAGNLFMQTK